MMNNYAVKCTCGDEVKVQATSMDEAKMKLKGMMNDEAILAHWNQKHAGQPNMPTRAQSDMMIDTTTYQVM